MTSQSVQQDKRWVRQRATRMGRWVLRLVATPLVVLGFGLVLLAGLGALWWKASELYANSEISAGAEAGATATTRAGILVVCAATIAAVGAALALIETRRANRETQRTNYTTDLRERYAKAIDQLGHQTVDVRLGAIYTLERLAEDSDRDMPTVVAVLCAFVRVHGKGPEDDSDNEGMWRHRPPPDVQAALTVIGRVHTPPSDWELHPERDKHIDLQDAHLECVNVSRGNLVAAFMARAVLTRSALRETKLSGAFLWAADLTWGNLIDADMTGARLSRADMTHANLTGADLAGADLHGAILVDTDLTGAKGLTQDQLEHSRGDEKTRLPDGLEPPMHWIHLEAVGEARAEDEVRRAGGEKG